MPSSLDASSRSCSASLSAPAHSSSDRLPGRGRGERLALRGGAAGVALGVVAIAAGHERPVAVAPSVALAVVDAAGHGRTVAVALAVALAAGRGRAVAPAPPALLRAAVALPGASASLPEVLLGSSPSASWAPRAPPSSDPEVVSPSPRHSSPASWSGLPQSRRPGRMGLAPNTSQRT